jgi:phosphoribosylanthranilate isomerase
MTWVKICGITNLEDAKMAVDAGADALGFVFYEKSPRRVDVETVREIVAKLPEKVEKVGVFVDVGVEDTARIARVTGLTASQISGTSGLAGMWEGLRRAVARGESPRLVPSISGLEFATAGIHIENEFKSHVMGVLIDSSLPGQPGGTGKMFDWEAAHVMISLLSRQCPTIVAGGLTPENVGEAIRLLQPFGVDVSSGVEVRPGKKDPAKVRAFVKAAKEAGRVQ